MGSLGHKRVLITGAAGGFGSAITRTLRARGTQVAGLDRVAAEDVIRCDITDYPGYVRTPIHRAPEAAGVTLEGKVPAERVTDVVRAVLRTVAASAPSHDTGTTWWGGPAARAARYLPVLASHAVQRRHGRDLDAGHYDAVPIARRMVRARRDGELDQAVDETEPAS